MNLDLIVAIVALLRADVTILPHGGTLTTAVGGRFYVPDEVPTDADFPRAYVYERRMSRIVNYSDGMRDRWQLMNVDFATRSQQSQTNRRDIEEWLKRTIPVLHNRVVTPNLVSFRYVGEDPVRTQNDDRASYNQGGIIYEAYFQEQQP